MVQHSFMKPTRSGESWRGKVRLGWAGCGEVGQGSQWLISILLSGNKRMATARLNLTIPSDLKEEMDSLSGEFSWSEVASRAFREHIDIHRQRDAERPSSTPYAVEARSMASVAEILKTVDRETAIRILEWVKNRIESEKR